MNTLDIRKDLGKIWEKVSKLFAENIDELTPEQIKMFNEALNYLNETSGLLSDLELKEYRIFYFGKYGHTSFVKKFKNENQAREYALNQNLDIVGIEEEK